MNRKLLAGPPLPVFARREPAGSRRSGECMVPANSLLFRAAAGASLWGRAVRPDAPLASTDRCRVIPHAPSVGADAPSGGADPSPGGADASPGGADASPVGADALPVGADALPVGADALPVGARRAEGNAAGETQPHRPQARSGPGHRAVRLSGHRHGAALHRHRRPPARHRRRLALPRPLPSKALNSSAHRARS